MHALLYMPPFCILGDGGCGGGVHRRRGRGDQQQRAGTTPHHKPLTANSIEWPGRTRN